MSMHLFRGARARPRPAMPRGNRWRIDRHFRIAATHLAVATVALFVCGISQASSQVAPPYPVLFRDSEGMAPRLLEAEANRRAAEGRSVQAGYLPNPTVSLYSENLGSSVNSGFSTLQSTLSVNQPIEFGERERRGLQPELRMSKPRSCKRSSQGCNSLMISRSPTQRPKQRRRASGFMRRRRKPPRKTFGRRRLLSTQDERRNCVRSRQVPRWLRRGPMWKPNAPAFKRRSQH